MKVSEHDVENGNGKENTGGSKHKPVNLLSLSPSFSVPGQCMKTESSGYKMKTEKYGLDKDPGYLSLSDRKTGH